MRRIALPLVLLVAACDPTGNTNISAGSAQLRFAAFVSDPTVGGVNVTSPGGSPLVTGLTYGNVSGYKSVDPDSSVLSVTRASDNFAMGSKAFIGSVGHRYTMYMMGAVASFKAVIAPDDTIFADSGKVKVRFVHAVRSDSLFGFDLYITAPGADISGITPQVASLTYGAASLYVSNDTASRQLRVTHAGLKTVEFDTTFIAAFADSQVVTVVAADEPSGGRRLQKVVDRAP